MTLSCSLCTCEPLASGDVTSKLVDEFSLETGWSDYLGLKRALEDEYAIDVTVSDLKRHVDEHVSYRRDPGAVEVVGR